MEFRFSYLNSVRSVRASFTSLVVLAIALLLLETEPARAALLLADQDAILAIAEHWPILRNGDRPWISSTVLTACDGDWRGLVCGTTTTSTERVLEIHLSTEQLTNNIAPAIFYLDALAVLDLSNNSLTGPLPSIWDSLANLSSLDLSANQFNGTLPDTIGSFSPERMESLKLGSNGFTGFIPTALQNLVGLKHLNVSLTSLTGYLLDWVGGFPELRSLAAANTKLIPATWIPFPGAMKEVYAISPAISNCTHLNLLDLRQTNVGDRLPGELGELNELETLLLDGAPNFPNVTHLTSVKYLDFSFNYPNALPEDMGDMTGLEYLRIGGSMLGQSLPSSLAQLASLRVLDLRHTSFAGPFPSFFSNLTSLVNLQLYGTQFSGLLPLDAWPQIEYLDATGNQFTSLPTILSSSLNSLVTLGLDGNALTELPIWIGSLPSLNILCFQDNDISSIPPSIALLAPTLEILLMADNPISDLPVEMAQLKGLKSLSLAGLKFDTAPFNATHYHSHIFDIVTSMTSLNTLIMISNHLGGTIPETLGQLSNLTTLYLSANELSGSIPDSINEGLPNIKHLYLEENQLNGTIPGWLGFKSSLNTLLLSYNAFEGAIPPELSNLKIHSLDLSHNKLSGSIPYELGEAPYLIALDLSYNELTGSIPTSFNYSAPSRYFSGLDLSFNKLTFCPSEIQEFPFYLHVSGICNLKGQKEPWTRPYDCGCLLDAFDRCAVDYPLEQCVPCAGNPPNADADFECQHGKWVLIGENPSITNTTIVIGPTPVIIPGNLTLTNITFEGLDGSLTVTGCASITNITIVFKLSDIEKLINLPESERTKVLVGSSGQCSLQNVPLTIVNPLDSCAKAYASSDGSSGSLIAAFSIDKSRCEKSKWWIILVAVIATVLVLTVAAGLIWYFIKRHKAESAHARISVRSANQH